VTAETVAALTAVQVVPVVTIDDASVATDLASALIDGGLPCAEITLRTSAALEAIRAVAGRPDLLVGAGTVTTARQVDEAVDAGARFIVSPGFGQDVVTRAQDLGVLAIPGVATASELQAATSAGLSAVKLFPVNLLGGVAAIRALSAPFPDVRFMPSGGVRLDNAGEYLNDRAVFAVGGSWMVPPSALAAGDFELVCELASQTVAGIAACAPAGAADLIVPR
jgi:2-dehydro-3-deoxyphosphogluconate aldolase/(4S)-4-hydroxy-2-oxoglutarate aldolase